MTVNELIDRFAVRRPAAPGSLRFASGLALACVLGFLACASFARAQPIPAAMPAVERAVESPAAETGSAETGSAAATPAESALPTEEVELKGEKIYVGVYLTQISEMSLKENKFTADFYVWFRYKTAAYKPWEKCDVVGGKVETREVNYQTRLGDELYAGCHFVAAVTQFWDVIRFPLDNHELRIQLEDNANEEFKVQYLPDTKNSGSSPDLQVPGWSVRPPRVEVVRQRYQTNYGDTSLPTDKESVYSRFVFTVPLVRQGIGYFSKLFLGLFVATSIAFLAMFIRPTEVDPRFGLGVGAIFAAVASEYVVTASLPDTNKLTLADMLHMLAFVFIFLTLVESTISLALWHTEDESKIRFSKRMDHCAFVVLVSAYVACTALCVYWA